MRWASGLTVLTAAHMKYLSSDAYRSSPVKTVSEALGVGAHSLPSCLNLSPAWYPRIILLISPRLANLPNASANCSGLSASTGTPPTQLMRQSHSLLPPLSLHSHSPVSQTSHSMSDSTLPSIAAFLSVAPISFVRSSSFLGPGTVFLSLPRPSALDPMASDRKSV